MGRKFEGYKLKKYSWSENWYVIGGKIRRVSTCTEDREEAEKFKADLIANLDKEQTGTISVAQALEDYMQEHAQYKPSAETTKFYSVPLHDFFGAMDADSIRPIDVRNYTAKKRNDGLADSTIRRQLVVLNAALHHAHKEHRLNTVPFIAMPDESAPKQRWLTHKEADKLLAHASDYMRLFILLALYTGARKTAILDLKWDQVDMERLQIDYNPAGRVQTTKVRASVPIENEQLIAALKDARKKRCTYVVTYHGKRIKDIKKGFAETCVAAKLDDVTPHTLRHTCATWLAQAGVDLWTVGGILGQSLVSTTAAYAKHSTQHLRDAVKKMDVAQNLQRIDQKPRRKPQKFKKAC